MSIFLSVLVPTYNQADKLRECLDSLIVCNRRDIEIVVGDDASSDETPALLEAYTADSRLRVVRNPTRLGRTGNYRRLLTEARGEWTVMVDGDDVYLDVTWFDRVFVWAQTNPDLVWAQAGEKTGENLKEARLKLPDIPDEAEVVDGKEWILRYPTHKHFSHMTTVYRTQPAREIGFYRMDNLSSDIESVVRLAALGKVGLDTGIAGFWRRHPQSAVSTAEIGDLEENLVWIDSCAAFFLDRKLFSEPIVRRWQNRLKMDGYHSLYGTRIARSVKQGSFQEAVSLFLRFVRKRPRLLLSVSELRRIAQKLKRPVA